MSAYTPPPDVKIAERHTLQCANPNALDGLESPFRLGPIDSLALPLSLIGVHYIYKKPTPETALGELIPVDRLRRSLEHLLDYYPHLTGRLRLPDPDRNQLPTIDSLGKGAELVVAECSTTLDEIAARDSAEGRILPENLPDYGRALLTQPESTLEAIRRDPVLIVQHTRFACGGASLGITLHHMVCDGHGYFQFVRDLAQVYRVLRASESAGHATTPRPFLMQPPVIRAYLSEPDALTPQEQAEALSFQPDSVTRSPPLNTWSTPNAPPVIGRLLRFPGAELAALKAHATNPNATDTNTSWISTFEALTAHLCQRIYLARLHLLQQTQNIPPSSASSLLKRTFLASLNMRGPARLGLSPRYFPNGTHGPTTSFPHSLLSDTTPLWKVAEAVHDTFRSVTPETMDKTVRWVAASRGKARSKFEYGEGSFLVSQWSCFRMYDGVEFERGVAPVLVAGPLKPGGMVDGLVVVLSTEEDLRPVGECEKRVRAVDVAVMVAEPVWEVLERDGEFRRFRG